LDEDYLFAPNINSAYLGGINITQDNFIIDGNGHTIDGSCFARIFNIQSGNVTLKNINFVNGMDEDGKAGTKNLVIKFESANTNPVKKTVKITINKEKTKVTAKKKTFKRKVKTKKYSITLKNSKGKAVQKVSVTLKVKGKTYNAKTNTKGKANFKIKKLTKKGNYSAKITFKGNAYYSKATKTVKIKIK
jgi:hypothetical protein